ncbi:MAG: DNA primase [Lautropia sp.]
MIPPAFIQELLGRVDIVDVIGRAVKLKKAGANLQGLCPFHNEKSPSFTVSSSKQFYHCFGCGAHGSAIGFLMEHHGLGFVEAVHDLAGSVGLTVPQEPGRGPGGPGGGDIRPASPGLPALLERAGAYYRQRLKETPAAIEYLKARGLEGRTAARFGIGYAPSGWRSLEAAVPDYADPEMVAAGLVISGDDGKRYDRFRERIMFPIRNTRGQLIGFGGRVLGDGEPKYLNSPEGPLFSKGRELYGLFEARDAIRARDCVLVVEGYMDVVMLHQHGCEYAVATLGTATTAAHLTKLLRQAERVVFAFDGDAAGRRAAWRALENALSLLSDTKRLDFLFLPPAHDPDSFIREHGLAAFEALVAQALPLSLYLLRELTARVDLGTPEGRARLQAELKPLVQAMPEVALRGQIVLEVAARAQVDAGELMRFLGLRPALAPAQPWQRPAAGGGRGGGGFGADPRFGADRLGADRRGGPDARFGGRDRFGAGRSGADHSGRSGADWFGAPGRPGFAGGRADGARPGAGLRGRAAAPPTLAQQLKLLLAYHPALAHDPFDPRFVPEEVQQWHRRIAALPSGSNFAALLEGLRLESPALAQELEQADARDPGLTGSIPFDQARSDYRAALVRLQLQSVNAEITALAEQGLESAAARTRYSELTAARQQLSDVANH